MRNWIAVVFGCILTFVLLLSLEGFFRLNEEYQWLSSRVSVTKPKPASTELQASKELFEKFKNEPVFQWQSILTREIGDKVRQEGVDTRHFLEMPCCVGRKAWIKNLDHTLELKSKETGTVIFRVHYTVDSLGRRITPKAKNPQYNILAFGDSYTYGVGVNNSETFPYVLGSLRPKAQVYNLGLGASSPAEALYELTQDQERLRDIPKRRTVVIYSFMDNHLERLFCRSLCVTDQNQWMQRLPYYSLEGDQIVFKGHFDLNRRVENLFYGLISSSAFLKHFGVVWPLRFTKKHFEFFAGIMQEQEKAAALMFPDSEFYLVLYPGSSDVFGPMIKQAAVAQNIKVLDYSGLDMVTATGDRLSIEGEGHPSPITQFILAQLLNRDLPQ